ncbi:MAG: tRNA epoxyqueuosine(34) reductase QueG [Oligoflexia bacterium]|nr:tRNA epoxyqueuosine(34) reductase QueG [Oligoflexia bacterium]
MTEARTDKSCRNMLPRKSLTSEEVKDAARAVGLNVNGFTDMAPFSEATPSLRVWQNEGMAGKMEFMLRDPVMMTSPGLMMESARALISCAVAYDRRQQPVRPSGYGRVARYAWGRDYHEVLAERLRLLAAKLAQRLGRRVQYRCFSDAVPFLERAAAVRAGLGFVGKNTLLISAGRGSFTLLGELLVDFEIEGARRGPVEVEGSCGSCRKCLRSCPTEALNAEYQVDARRCISYLTIEKRGMLEWPEREMLGEWVLGCDICQEVCPFNHRALKEGQAAELHELDSEQGLGPLVNLKEALAFRSHAEFRKRYWVTPLRRIGRPGLLRNALCVAANTGALELGGDILECIERDPSPVVRATAHWAAMKFAMLDARVRRRLKKVLGAASPDACTEVNLERQRIAETL